MEQVSLTTSDSKKNPKILLINSWFGKIPDYYKFHEKTMQYQSENIDMFFFTDQDLSSDNLSKNYKIFKISEDNIKFRFFVKTGRKFENTLIGRTSLIKLFFLNNFFDDIINYSNYDYVGIYDTDTLFNNIYDWILPYLGDKNFISVGGGVNHHRLSGPFCIFRNIVDVMKLFETEQYFENLMRENVDYLEQDLDKLAKSSNSIEILQYSQNIEHETSKILFDAEWSGGKLYCENKEILVHHFYRKKHTNLSFQGNSIISNLRKTLVDDFYWVTYFTENYEKLVYGLIDSIKKFSNRKCILYTINYTSDLQYKLDDQFVIRRLDIKKGDLDISGRDNSIISSKPIILADAVDFIKDAKFIYVDTDVYLTSVADSLGKFFSKLENYPLFNSHVHDKLFANDIFPTGEWVSTIDILSEVTNIPIRVFPRRKTNVILYDKNSKWFFEEQMELYYQYRNTKPGIFRLHDEDSANIILSKYDFKNSLPLIDMEESSNINFEKFENYSYNISLISQHVVLPKNENEIYIFHGFKDDKFYLKIQENYCKTILDKGDFTLEFKNNTLFIEKNSFLNGKQIEETVDFIIKNGDGEQIFNLANQKIFQFWLFYVSNLNLKEKKYYIEIVESTRKRIIYKNVFETKQLN